MVERKEWWRGKSGGEEREVTRKKSVGWKEELDERGRRRRDGKGIVGREAAEADGRKGKGGWDVRKGWNQGGLEKENEYGVKERGGGRKRKMIERTRELSEKKMNLID